MYQEMNRDERFETYFQMVEKEVQRLVKMEEFGWFPLWIFVSEYCNTPKGFETLAKEFSPNFKDDGMMEVEAFDNDVIDFISSMEE